jgi:hypothetical protein
MAATTRTAAQSAHLSALESSAPAAVVEPLAGAFGSGVGGLFGDPTSAPRDVGALFGMYRASYAGVEQFHAVAAFAWGPRWSLAYATNQITDLFDSSLTAQDPSLANLRARALWTALDATVARGRLAGSGGVALAADENLGPVETSTIGRLHLRASLARGLSLGVHSSFVLGGTIATPAGGRHALDATAYHTVGAVTGALTVAVSRGSLWDLSETRGGVGLAGRLNVAGMLDVAVGAGRYETTYGATRSEWQRSALVGVRVGAIRFSARYTASRLGLGSGYGLAVGYEPLR